MWSRRLAAVSNNKTFVFHVLIVITAAIILHAGQWPALPAIMNRRPLYRWKSFWLGMLMLGFLGCAWVRSVGHLDEVAVAVRSSKVVANCASGEIAVTRYPRKMRGWIPEFESATVNGGFERRWTGPVLRIRIVELPPAGAQLLSLRVGHWFLILLFLVPWVSFLAWRWRRMGRLAAGSAESLERKSV